MTFNLKYLCLFLFFVESNSLNYQQNVKIQRRDLINSCLLIPTICNADVVDNTIFKLSPTFNNLDNNNDDKYAHWSLYGLAPPHIEKTINYKELIEYVDKNLVYSLQPAFWHDCIIVTTKNGHRLTFSIKEKDYDNLFTDILKKNNNIYILPVDPIRSNIRNVAQVFFYPSFLFYILSELDIIPYQIVTYNSIKERDEFKKLNKKPDKIITKIKNILNNFTNN